MKRKAPFKFDKFSEKQLYVLRWWNEDSKYKDKDGIICDGSIRSGKTTVMSLSFVMWAMASFDGENFALCGKTIQSLRRNVIKQLKKMLKARGYAQQIGIKGIIQYNGFVHVDSRATKYWARNNNGKVTIKNSF